MKMHQLVDASPVLRKIAGQEVSLKTLYNIEKALSKLDHELKFYDNRRMELMKAYCEYREEKYTPKEECADEFNRKFGELLNLDIELRDFKKAKIPSGEPIRLSYRELQLVRDFIEIEWEDEDA